MTGSLAARAARGGVFISFEGGDGVGKSTQINQLADELRRVGHVVVITREPGGSEGAELVRNLLVTGDKDRWSPMTELLLMYASRRDHLEKTILPALDRGDVVISDRFADSSMAYQGYAGALGPDVVSRVHSLVVGENDPDLTIVLDASPEIGIARAMAGGEETRFEEKGISFQKQVRDGFRTIAQANPKRCQLIGAEGSIEEVAAAIKDAVQNRLPLLFDR